MFSCPSPPRELSLSVIPHVPGHLSVQYTVLRAPQWEVSKGITLCQDPFLSSVGNGQSLEQEISYSISKASFCISGVPTSGCELCPCLRVEEEGSVSFPVPGPWPLEPPRQMLLIGHTGHWSYVVRLSPKEPVFAVGSLCLRGQSWLTFNSSGPASVLGTSAF